MNVKEKERRKIRVSKAMLSTAMKNGKDVNLEDMIKLAERLHRIESTLCRLAEEECYEELYNRFWKDGVNPTQERKEELAKEIIEKEIGCRCYTQRDPRGMKIRMYLVGDDGEKWFNSWDGETTGFDW